jgi:hypothetical protein
MFDPIKPAPPVTNAFSMFSAPSSFFFRPSIQIYYIVLSFLPLSFQKFNEGLRVIFTVKHNYLKSVLVGESRAYGFTIAFWGSGAALIQAFGVPGFLQIISYAFGAVIGFGLITLYAFRKTLSAAKYERPDQMVLGMVHYLASIAPILLTMGFTFLGEEVAFLLSGINVPVVYNLLMVVEEVLSEEAAALEQKLQS